MILKLKNYKEVQYIDVLFIVTGYGSERTVTIMSIDESVTIHFEKK